jgi:hypothetical protein
MESQVNPNNIQDRADKLTAVEKPVETAAPVAPVAPVTETPKTEVSSTPTEVKKTEIKSVEPVEPAKQPNDPIELRKWATKASQENAALREEMKAVKNALNKLTKKPVDYKELAKNPEAIQKQIELERQEAIEEMQTQLEEKALLATKNETVVERMKREQDTTNYPEWKRVFPLIQNLAANTDGRINFNKAPGDVLDDLYALANQLAPAQAPMAKVEPVPVTPPAPVGKSPEENAAEIDAAEKRGFARAQEAMRNEANGAGLGSAGKGGRRSSGVSKDALHDMPLGDLKKLISQE